MTPREEREPRASEHAAAEVPSPTAASGAPEQASAAPEAGAGQLAEQVQRLQQEKQELTNTLVHRQADFENYRKRLEKERHQDRRRGAEAVIESVLPILDAFDRALGETGDAAYREYRKGFDLIRRQLWETLAKQGVVRIEAMGQEFNPHFHHAIERVETTEHADGIVIGELQPGYLFHERVLRPAMVRVASVPESKSARVLKQDD